MAGGFELPPEIRQRGSADRPDQRCPVEKVPGSLRWCRALYDGSVARASGDSATRIARDLADVGPSAVLAPELAEWLAGSSRFGVFVAQHRAKIRKKLRGATDAGSVRDVRAELAVARLLLADRRFELTFEPYGRGGGPDFTVTFRAGRPCNLEVTRLRRPPDAAAVAGVVLGKLRQLPPSIPNVLLVAVEDVAADAVDVGAAIRSLRSRADVKDEAYFAFRGVDGTRTFNERLLRLGGVIVWCEAAEAGQRTASWANRSARIAVPEATTRALLACLRA